MHLPGTDCTHGLVGQSPQIRRVRRLIETLAASDAPVLIAGETGTGKEVVARALYDANPRGEFVTIDCSTLAGPLMESELFGYARGAFTGAVDAKKGLIELADQGTAFFDEIGELPLEMQAKLLRLLQEQEFRALGTLKSRKVRTRVIAATNRDLREMVEGGKFREDLYYRLNVAKISLPPLRERREDIPLLIEHFLRRQSRPVDLAPDLYGEMTALRWPGNVRELKNCIDRMVAMTGEHVLRLADLPTHLQHANHFDGNGFVLACDDPIVSLAELEKRAILHAIAVIPDKDEAARRLGIGRTTLFRKLKEYGSDDDRAGRDVQPGR
jgi:transcriptional regulator with PAS, ATPase and Fis domain